MDPQKDVKRYLFGGPFWPSLSLGQLLALSWGPLLLSCRLLVPRASKREVQEPPKSCPRESERGSRETKRTQESSGEFQDRPKSPLGHQKMEVPKIHQQLPKTCPRELRRDPREAKREPSESRECQDRPNSQQKRSLLLTLT